MIFNSKNQNDVFLNFIVCAKMHLIKYSLAMENGNGKRLRYNEKQRTKELINQSTNYFQVARADVMSQHGKIHWENVFGNKLYANEIINAKFDTLLLRCININIIFNLQQLNNVGNLKCCKY